MFKLVGVVAAVSLAFLIGSARGTDEKQVCRDSLVPVIEVLSDAFGDGTIEYDEIEKACDVGVREYLRTADDGITS